jgi:hypothetical protein
MSATYTQGPWTYVENGEANCYQVRDNTGRWALALRHNGEDVTEQQRANMRLIAAAPDLLDALHRVLRHIPNDAGGCSLSDDIDRAKKAIKKAEHA